MPSTSSYTLTFTDSNLKPPIQVQYGSVDTVTSSLQLFGIGAGGYGDGFQENFLALLENFCGPTPPNSPTIGQLWYNYDLVAPNSSQLLLYNAAGSWVPLSSGGSGSGQPYSVDLTSIANQTSSTGVLKKISSGNWVLDTTPYLTANQTITLTGDITGSGTTDITTSLALQPAIIPGTYNNVSVNTKGIVISANNVGYLTANQNINVIGDVLGSGSTALNLTLVNSGVSAGTYTNVTVDAKGRVTAGNNVYVPTVSTLDPTSPVTTIVPTTLGQFWFDTTTHKLYVSTPPANPLQPVGTGNPYQWFLVVGDITYGLAPLSNPTDGTLWYNTASNVLSYYSNGAWQAILQNVAQLSDVVLTTLNNGDVLTWNSASGKWINAAVQSGSSGATALSQLTDVQVTIYGGTNKVVLMYDQYLGKWTDINLSLSGGYISDVQLGGTPTKGQVLCYGKSNTYSGSFSFFTNYDLRLHDLYDVNPNLGAANTGDVLTFNGTQWTNQAATSGSSGADSRISSPTFSTLPTNTGATGELAIGDGAFTASIESLAIGFNANANSPTAAAYGARASATGAASVALGANSVTSATSGIAIGNTAYANQPNGISIGAGNQSNHAAAVALGNYVSTDMVGEFTYASGQFGDSAFGSAKISFLQLMTTTTTSNYTNVELGLNAGSASDAPTNYIVLTDNSVYIFDVDITAISTNFATDGYFATFNLRFTATRGAGASTTAVYLEQANGGYNNSPSTSWAVTATADVVNGRPAIQVTGDSTTQVRWVGNAKLTKVTA